MVEIFPMNHQLPHVIILFVFSAMHSELASKLCPLPCICFLSFVATCQCHSCTLRGFVKIHSECLKILHLCQNISWTWRSVVPKGRRSDAGNASLCRHLSQLPSSSDIPQQRFGNHLCAIDYFTPRDNESLQGTPRRNTCFREINTLFALSDSWRNIDPGDHVIVVKKKKKKKAICAHAGMSRQAGSLGAQLHVSAVLLLLGFLASTWLWIAGTRHLTALQWKNSWMH